MRTGDRLIISKPNGDHSEPLKIPDAKSMVREQARRGSSDDGWRLKTRGDHFGTIRHDLSVVMERWDRIVMDNSAVGDVIVLDMIDHPYSIVARWVDIEDPLHIRNTEGNSDIDIIYSDWHQRYPGSRNAGICVFKGDPPSQHCRWVDNDEKPGDGANANDEFLATMEAMLDAAYESVRLGKRFQKTNGDDGIPLGRMIIADKIWDPFQEWHPYYGFYHRHNHMEGRWWMISGSAVRC